MWARYSLPVPFPIWSNPVTSPLSGSYLMVSSSLVLLLGGIVHLSLSHGGAGHLSIFDGVIDETASDIEVGGDDIHLTKIVEDDAEDQAQASHEKNADHE